MSLFPYNESEPVELKTLDACNEYLHNLGRKNRLVPRLHEEGCETVNFVRNMERNALRPDQIFPIQNSEGGPRIKAF